MGTALEIFRVLATEFAAVGDEPVQMWIGLTAPLVSKKLFGRVYNQALALLTAHRMKTAGVGMPGAGDELGDIGGVGAALKVASYSSGGESISFNNNALTAELSADAEFSQTVYGIQYVTLRKLYSIPIISAGEKANVAPGRC